MLRSAVIAVLALSGCAQAAQPGEPAGTPESQALQLARETLAQRLHVAETDITVSHVTARTWNDSSMGCGTPGTVAATVITEGYAVTAAARGHAYLVHVSGANAIVCDKAGVVLREPAAARGAGIDVMMERARQDLARRLGVAPAKIRLGGVQPKQWPDSGLGCPQEGEKLEPGPVEGLVLTLKHAGRVFSYHTDRKTVRPCPAIEAE